jgi:hypothetical protein
MRIVEFYRGERPNVAGNYLSEIMEWTDGFLEGGHDWVQWTFPSNEMSSINVDAPTLTRDQADVFISDPELRQKLKTAFVRFLQFLRFEITRDDGVVVIEAKEELPHWLQTFNHNMFRVTRVLKSLRLTGHQHYAIALFEALRPFRDRVSPNTWSYWQRAVNEDLWR